MPPPGDERREAPLPPGARPDRRSAPGQTLFDADKARSCAQLLIALICSSIVLERGTVFVICRPMSSSDIARFSANASIAADWTTDSISAPLKALVALERKTTSNLLMSAFRFFR